MASNYTRNYNLCQWAAEDKVLRTEFNADNAKIDAALAGKASTSALTALENTVNSKLSGLQGTVSGQETSLSLRNCQFITGRYTGTGKAGPDNPTTITFPRKPVFLVVRSPRDARAFFAISGQSFVWYPLSGNNRSLNLTWGSRSVSWYFSSTSNSDDQLNSAHPYDYFAILELDS